MHRTGMIGSAVLVGIISAGSAQASTLTQTFTNSTDVSFSNLTDIGQQLVPQSFFTGTFQPFVGSALSSAIIQLTFTFEGSVTTPSAGGGASVGFSGNLYANTVVYSGTGGGGGNGGAPNSVYTFSASAANTSDLLGGNPALVPIVEGNSPFTVSYQNIDPGPVTYTGTPGGQLSGHVTATEVLTYTYEGNGALLPPANSVPEPASLLLLGSGLVALGGSRRRISTK